MTHMAAAPATTGATSSNKKLNRQVETLVNRLCPSKNINLLSETIKSISEKKQVGATGGGGGGGAHINSKSCVTSPKALFFDRKSNDINYKNNHKNTSMDSNSSRNRIPASLSAALSPQRVPVNNNKTVYTHSKST